MVMLITQWTMCPNQPLGGLAPILSSLWRALGANGFGLRWLRAQCLCFAFHIVLPVGFVTESPHAEPRPCRSCPETSQPQS